MAKIADISRFEELTERATSSVIHNAGSFAPQRVPTRMDVEFGWKYRWVTDSKGRIGIQHSSDVASLGTCIRRNMKPVFTNLKNAILQYNQAASKFSNDIKAMQRSFTPQDARRVSNIIQHVRGFQSAGKMMMKQFNINMPVAR